MIASAAGFVEVAHPGAVRDLEPGSA